MLEIAQLKANYIDEWDRADAMEQATWEAAATSLERAADTPIPVFAEGNRAAMELIKQMLRDIAKGFRARSAAQGSQVPNGGYVPKREPPSGCVGR
jgi:hypothetical protein